ncbi:DUF2163 domain-containing protein [Phreatobacter aquaticus]|uniref:DUF2163 domain-containing protein n=1 Tax=Phreatobacter aquaticus TaxID=2570229 RepID=A0A4D7QLW7_9HYPH|nr:DUF2163 domain-containing protein [Phreatobacter aquaticus]QCK86639.1 DUF2163 domain-containing protein [Phreatobacter aquaticus]
MRTIPSALQTKLDQGATTLATCWILRRRDGLVQGFTDHDDDLVCQDVPCLAMTGFDGAAAAEKLGFAISGGEISGALVADSLTEADIAAGRYDGAIVEIHWVDWSEPELLVLLRVMTLGEITRESGAFKAELRSLAQALDVERGRLYTPGCSADLGDARCGVDLAAADRRATATVLAVEATGALVCSGLGDFVSDALNGGRLLVETGAAAGFSVEIAAQAIAADGVWLALWQTPPEPIVPGDSVAVTVGCDKRFATCRDRFANALNFRGFPHMPGIDRIVSVPLAGEAGHDGSSLQA